MFMAQPPRDAWMREKQTLAWAPTAPGPREAASIKTQFPRGRHHLRHGPCTEVLDAALQSWALSCLPGPYSTPRGPLSQSRKWCDAGVSGTEQAQDKTQGPQDSVF